MYVGMLERDFGQIVNISSIWGKTGMAIRSTYSASKHALVGLTTSLYYEVKILIHNVHMHTVQIKMWALHKVIN